MLRMMTRLRDLRPTQVGIEAGETGSVQDELVGEPDWRMCRGGQSSMDVRGKDSPKAVQTGQSLNSPSHTATWRRMPWVSQSMITLSECWKVPSRIWLEDDT